MFELTLIVIRVLITAVAMVASSWLIIRSPRALPRDVLWLAFGMALFNGEILFPEASFLTLLGAGAIGIGLGRSWKRAEIDGA